MRQSIRILFFIWIMLGLLSNPAAQQIESGKPDIDINAKNKNKGLEIVFVIDVSYSIEGCHTYVFRFIDKVFDAFNINHPGGDQKSNTQNCFHLITFSDYASYKGKVKNSGEVRDKVAREMELTKDELSA